MTFIQVTTCIKLSYPINHKPSYRFLTLQGAKMLTIFLLVLVLPISFAQDSEKKKETKEKECPPYVCVKNGNFADPCHCRRYITCTNGAATTRVCPSGLYWDDERLFCTYKSEAKCGPIKR